MKRDHVSSQRNEKQTSHTLHTSYQRFTFLSQHSSVLSLAWKALFSRETSQLILQDCTCLIWRKSWVQTAVAVFVFPLPQGWLGQEGDAWRSDCGVEPLQQTAGRGRPWKSRCRLAAVTYGEYPGPQVMLSHRPIFCGRKDVLTRLKNQAMSFLKT